MPTIVAEVNRAGGYIKLEIDWIDIPAVTKARILRYPATYDAQAYVPTTVRSFQPLIVNDGYSLYTMLSHGKAVFYDFEAPLDQPITYVTDSIQNVATASTIATLPSVTGVGWLIDPLRPYLNLALSLDGSMNKAECTAVRGVYFAGLAGRKRAADSQVFEVPGALRPVAAYGPRKDYTSQVRLATRQLADRDAVDAILATGTPLLLQLTAEYGENDQYMQLGDVQTDRLGPDMRKPYRVFQVPYAVVDSPEGESQGAVGTRWRDLCQTYSTWGAMKADRVTWQELARPGTVSVGDKAKGVRFYPRREVVP